MGYKCYNLLIKGVYWGYYPLTNHLLTSWDIQVGEMWVPPQWNSAFVDEWNSSIRDENDEVSAWWRAPQWTEQVKIPNIQPFFFWSLKQHGFLVEHVKSTPHHLQAIPDIWSEFRGEHTNPHKVFGALTGTFLLIKFQPLMYHIPWIYA